MLLKQDLAGLFHEQEGHEAPDTIKAAILNEGWKRVKLKHGACKTRKDHPAVIVQPIDGSIVKCMNITRLCSAEECVQRFKKIPKVVKVRILGQDERIGARGRHEEPMLLTLAAFSLAPFRHLLAKVLSIDKVFVK